MVCVIGHDGDCMVKPAAMKWPGDDLGRELLREGVNGANVVAVPGGASVVELCEEFDIVVNCN
jgi:hypothetical protein